MMRQTSSTWQPGDAVLWLVLVLPFTTPLLLTTLARPVAVMTSPLFVYTGGLLLLVAAVIGQRDGWLGLLVGWTALGLLRTPTLNALEDAAMLAGSAVALLAVRRLPPARRALATPLLVALGLFQVGYGVQQVLGYDLFWNGLQPIPRPLGALGVLGTLGNRDYVGVYLAVLTPLVAWPWVPGFLGGLILAQSGTGLVAAAAGLSWRYRARWRMVLPGVVAFLLLGWWWRVQGVESLAARWEIWSLAVREAPGWVWLVGAGPGRWADLMPQWQAVRHVRLGEPFVQAHNDWLQLVFELGLVGLFFVLGWLWRWRAAFFGSYGGAWVAMAVASVTMFGCRLAITGSLFVLLLGLATAEAEQTADRDD